ncbi:HNH endonuclease signature motif containing protein [Roseateles sp. SL47]|uniref:HNH endonuclease n=1 Tax=Roseateles sp. SL47 TaxID=2995138 RepID=UPI00226D9FCB|nr:HNH endonuclease signature motif containing protein [Roseateles sp. SL47]WAC73153.1 HNH endonuclease signature motif containing protein [Roseateles sp. SL47]
MKAGLIFEARHYETYSLCSIVDGVIRNTSDHLRILDGFHCDGQWAGWLRPFQKYSVLHQFIEFSVRQVHAEESDGVDLEERKRMLKSFERIPEALPHMRPCKLPIEEAFDYHGIGHQSFIEHLADMGKSFADADDDDIYEFMSEVWLSEAYEKFMNITVDGVFHVLFQNRMVMRDFNAYISRILGRVNFDEADDLDRSLLMDDRMLVRVKPPKWAKDAVFHRDRGHCVMCNLNLSRMASLEDTEHYDHIVPLASWGLNDVTNLQLLCGPCNLKEKGDRVAITSARYQAWYPMDDDS